MVNAVSTFRHFYLLLCLLNKNQMKVRWAIGLIRIPFECDVTTAAGWLLRFESRRTTTSSELCRGRLRQLYAHGRVILHRFPRSGRSRMDLLSSGSSSDSDDSTAVDKKAAWGEGPPRKRIRNVPHEPGDWHAHVYISVPMNDAFRAVRESALKQQGMADMLQSKAFHWVMHDNFHISLSREFALKKHHIGPFVEALQNEIQHIIPFSVAAVDDVVVHVNDFQTRSFLALKVCGGSDHVKKVIDHVNVVAKKFSIPSYYDDPSIHISIASAVGNVHATKYGGGTSKKANDVEHTATADDDLLEFGLRVSEVCVVAGKRVYTIPLKNQI